MKVSVYKSYDELPLFLNSKIRAPGKTQRSGFAGERRSSGMNKPCRFWSRTTESTHGSCIQIRQQEFFLSAQRTVLSKYRSRSYHRLRLSALL